MSRKAADSSTVAISDQLEGEKLEATEQAAPAPIAPAPVDPPVMLRYVVTFEQVGVTYNGTVVATDPEAAKVQCLNGAFVICLPAWAPAYDDKGEQAWNPVSVRLELPTDTVTVPSDLIA